MLRGPLRYISCRPCGFRVHHAEAPHLSLGHEITSWSFPCFWFLGEPYIEVAAATPEAIAEAETEVARRWIFRLGADQSDTPDTPLALGIAA